MLVDIALIIMLESSGNPMAFNKATEARGLMQITQVCLDDYNQQNHAHFKPDQLFSPSINMLVGTWYIQERIPQLLKSKKKSLNMKNVLKAWSGSSKYIEKYKKLLIEKNIIE